jgi:hypothetical protein
VFESGAFELVGALRVGSFPFDFAQGQDEECEEAAKRQHIEDYGE